MKFLAVISPLVFFSCFVNCSELIQKFKLSLLQYNNNAEPFISQGIPAYAGEFKGQISIQKADTYPSPQSHICGGTVIDKRHVLTTATCVTTNNGSPLQPSYFMLVGDELNIGTVSNRRQAITASKIMIHPQYSHDAYYTHNKNDTHHIHNIAVIRTNAPFNATNTFSPVLRIQVTPKTKEICKIAGWGRTEPLKPFSPDLLRVNATIQDIRECKLYHPDKILDGMFCAGTLTGADDVCEGDVGGGLICENYIAGIATWGEECVKEHVPGIYVDIPTYNTWIEEQIIIIPDETDAPPTCTKLNGSTVSVLSFNLSFACVLMLLLTLSHNQ